MLSISIERLDAVPSTNTHALECAARGAAPHGTLYLAREQTAGRGTRGRTWHAPPGESVLASLVVAPPTPLISPAALSIAAGLAVHAATRSLGLAARLKWPNDVLVGPAKLAGILVERRGDGPYVIGIGWNVETRVFPPELEAERAVTSLACEGVATTVAGAEGVLAAELATWIERAWTAPQGLLADYLAAAGLLLGSEVATLGPGGTRRIGVLEAFDFAGGARLVTPAGEALRLPLEHLQALSQP